MANHTPGSWHVNKLLYPAGQDVSFEVLSGHLRFVAQTIMREVIKEDDDIAQDEANVRLIAAAPELLEACRAFVDWYNVDSTEQKRDDAFYAAQAAIAKAEGLG